MLATVFFPDIFQCRIVSAVGNVVYCGRRVKISDENATLMVSVVRWSCDFRPKKTAVISLGAGDWIFGRPTDCLDEGSVLTLKKYFKTTGRNLNDVLKYTVDDFRLSSDEIWAKCPPSRYNYITLHYIIYGSESCRVKIVHRNRAWLCEAVGWNF